MPATVQWKEVETDRQRLSSVFSLPPRLAGITPCLSTQNRSAVTPSSRTTMTLVTHQDSSPSTDKLMSAAPIRALSAIGSASLPNSVTRAPLGQPTVVAVGERCDGEDHGGRDTPRHYCPRRRRTA